MHTATTHAPAAAAGTTDDYRFDHPRIRDIINDMYIRKHESGPGDKVKPFDMETTDGGFLKSIDVSAKGLPVLLVFGSRTCPVTESAAEGLKQLHAIYGNEVRFVMVQVREAHPGQTIGQPKTPAEKLHHAQDLKRHHNLPFEVAVGDIDGTFHRSLGSRPNSAYLIDPSGTILFRAQWPNETEAIAGALGAILSGKKPPTPKVTRTFHAMTQTIGYMNPVLDAAGKGACLDTWKVAPPMGVMMTVSDLIFFLPPNKRGLPAMIFVMVTLALVAAAVISGS